MRYVIFLLFCTLLMACTTKINPEPPFLIAHAGGAIAGNRYLNSKEAVLQSIQQNFRYIELDLLQTTDGDLLAAHDWKTFHQLSGHPEQTAPISALQAKQRKILGQQTVLTSHEILEIFTQHPQLYLVTGKITNISLLREKFAPFLNRIIVELKLPNDCEDLSLKDMKQCAFLLDKPLPKTRAPVLATLPLRKVKTYKSWLLHHPNVQLLVYTVNDIETAKELARYPFVKGIYTDELSPTSLTENL